MKYEEYDREFREYLASTDKPKSTDFMKYTQEHQLPTMMAFIYGLKASNWKGLLRKYGIEITPPSQLPQEELMKMYEIECKRTKARCAAEFNRKTRSCKSYTFTKLTGIPLSQMIDNLKYKRRTDEEYKALYWEIANRIGHRPSLPELKENELYIPADRWPKLTDFLDFCGDELGRRQPKKVVESDEELIEMYKNFSKRIGAKKGATMRDLEASDQIYSAGVFAVRFGSFRRLKELCGFKPEQVLEQKYSKSGLTDRMLDYFHKLGHLPSIQDIESNRDFPSCSTFLRHFKVTSIGAVYKQISDSTEDEEFKSAYQANASYKKGSLPFSFFEDAFCNYIKQTEHPSSTEFKTYVRENSLPSLSTFVKRLNCSKWKELVTKYSDYNEQKEF